MATTLAPRVTFQRNRKLPPPGLHALCLGGTLAYSIREVRNTGALLPDEGLPPPLDHFPDFPNVVYDRLGRPSLVGPPQEIASTLCHIVPDPGNVYIQAFGRGGFRNWKTPEVAFELVKTWRDSGREVTIHPRCDGIQVAGESCGLAQFVLGGGISVFVASEVGLLPEGTELEGVLLERMVVTIGITFPNPGNHSANYHLFPAEYLADPVLPGLLPGLSHKQIRHYLPSPPGLPSGCPGHWVSRPLSYHHRVRCQ
jgi:hypothetical protein